MEEIRAYIESGILELYVLGDLSPVEKSEVEAMAFKHTEIKAELAEIESSLEAYALQNAVEPPEHLRDKILNSLLTNFADDRKFPTKPFTERSDLEGDDYLTGNETQNNIRVLPVQKENKFYKYAFAASLAVLIVSLGALYNTNKQLKESKGQIALLQTKNQGFANRVNLLDREVGVFRDSTVKIIKLQGTPKTPSSRLNVAWSPVEKKVLIDMKSLKLAENDATHQYQLWAMVNGSPVDLGVFDAKADSAGMVEMKSVGNAAVFAVTLEKRGGVQNPTMDQMVLLAKI